MGCYDYGGVMVCAAFTLARKPRTAADPVTSAWDADGSRPVAPQWL